MRILIIEDNKELALTAKEGLIKAGFKLIYHIQALTAKESVYERI